jgi:N-acetylglucosamine-6-sulfatase
MKSVIFSRSCAWHWALAGLIVSIVVACSGGSSVPGPNVSLTSVTPAAPEVGQPVSFVGAASGGSGIYTYAWSFGDGATDTSGASAGHQYAVPGNYNIQLTVTDSAGHAGTAQQALVVTGTAGPPNIVLILVDDFSMNLIGAQNDVLAKSMPNVAQMMRDGMTFNNHFVTDSLCCPSRASIFTGMLPHNTGVYRNDGDDGGFNAFVVHGNNTKSFAVALNGQSYKTSMMGKYLNLYNPSANGVQPGWSDWAVSGTDGYNEYDYHLNVNDNFIQAPPDLHLTDDISSRGQAFIQNSANGSFLLELASFSPHSPYVPPDRYKAMFLDQPYPVTPAYLARPDANAPNWLKAIGAVSTDRQKNILDKFRMRMQSNKGIDDMIGAVRQKLRSLGLAGNTYVIFTSDNGYHMGEYSLSPGKKTPFDTDIHVPLIVVGPGVAPGSSTDKITMNIDFAPTFRELARLPVSDTIDGQSFVPVLHGQTGVQRTLAVVEHRQDPSSTADPDYQFDGDPPDYVALRLKNAMYVEYATDEIGYYDLTTDPYELHNIVGTLTTERLAALRAAAQANHTCVGPVACLAAQSLSP